MEKGVRFTVIWDKRIAAKVKRKGNKRVERPAMVYGYKTGSLRKRQETTLEVAKLKMLRFTLRVMRMNRIRTKHIREMATTGQFGGIVREARLRWCGHLQRMLIEYIGRRIP